MRERVMSEITIKGVTKQDTGWTKEITLEREGETYLATLYWSSSTSISTAAGILAFARSVRSVRVMPKSAGATPAL